MCCIVAFTGSKTNKIKYCIYYRIDKDQILLKIITVVNDRAPDAEVYLYGYRARGDAKTLSDRDLLRLLNQQNIPFDFEARFLDEFYETELETGEIIRLIIISK